MFNALNLKKFAKDTSGQFSILMAVGLSVLTLGTAVAVDTAAATKTRANLFNVADAAALAGAIAAETGPSQRVKVVEDYIAANSSPQISALIGGNPIISFDDVRKEVTVRFDVQSKTLLGGFLGKDTVPVNAISVAAYGQSSVNPVSISFALDVSGSMGWATSDGQVKIEALKDSFTAMFLEIEDQVDDVRELEKSMRTGMSTYNTALQTTTNMGRGWRDTGRAVNRLVAGGGTNSTPSLQFAYDQIIQDRAFRLASDPTYNPAIQKEFVIFMTDGDNNQPGWDTTSRAVCDQMKSDGIEVFTVAFAAPAKGTVLLENCASADKDEHFFDASNAAAFKEAFREIGKEIVEKTIRITS